MHWPSWDKAMWGIILAVLAIGLNIPLNLVANLWTPKIRNWWAERSIAGLRRRINKLEKDFAIAKNYAFISEGEEFILDMIRLIVLLSGGIVTGFWGMAIFAVDTLPGKTHTTIRMFAVVAIVFIYALGIIPQYYINRFLKRRSPCERKSLEENIKKLTAKVQSLDPQYNASRLPPTPVTR